MSNQPFIVNQDIFKRAHSPIRVVPVHENTLVGSPQILTNFLSTDNDGFIGMAPVYGTKCALTALAFSTLNDVLFVRLSSAKPKGKKKRKNNARTPGLTPGQVVLRDNILCHPGRDKVAFRMDKLSASLFLDQNLRITGGVDLLSSSTSSRRSLDAIMNALGGVTTLHKENIITLFAHEEGSTTPERDVALQAWAACRVGSLPSLVTQLSQRPRIDTQAFSVQQLLALAKTLRDADRLDALKPTRVKNDIIDESSYKKGKLKVVSSRFKTRIMKSRTQTVEVVSTSGGIHTAAKGRATKVSGRSATISLPGSLPQGKIRCIFTIGKEDPTFAEAQRATIVLRALQQSNTILQHPFVRSLWLPSETPSWPKRPRRVSPSIQFPQRPLNPSQVVAVESILSDADRISIIQGPPGTGKTTVIAAGVLSMMAVPNGRTMWLIGHSNLAVKNIAEKLADVGFLNFKLLVSKDFHFDWHEHLYESIRRNVIESSIFPSDVVSANRLLLGCRVILCTLSMLSNHKISHFTRLVPVDIVVVDEASQIEIGDYLPMLSLYQVTLQKLVFIGDDKQLAPHGQDDIGDLRSIFEVPHLRKRAIFLDTQYRMPVPIGNFISRYVYDNKLATQHSITSVLSCQLLDVRNGKEERKNNSWINIKEGQAAINIARGYCRAGKAFRIITPYDAQRNRLENELKAAKLPWEDKCFNVDSFQGNEEDHIIISLVRSDKVGFLKNIRRTNVMLSRCKQSMVICTNRAFVNGIAASSLVGTLATVLGEQAWSKWP